MNFSVPSDPCAISWFTVTAVPFSASAPCSASGRLVTCTAFRLSSSASVYTPSKSAAANVSAVSSAVLLFSADAAGASATAVTVIVAAAVADSASAWSVTLNVKLASPFQSATGVNTSVPRSAFTIFWLALTAVPFSASDPAVDAGSVTNFTAFRLSPESESGSLNTPSNCAAVNGSAVSSVVLTPSARADGASFTAVTVTVAVAAADVASVASTSLNPNVASPA